MNDLHEEYIESLPAVIRVRVQAIMDGMQQDLYGVYAERDHYRIANAKLQEQIAALSAPHPTCETCGHNNGYGTCEKAVLTSNRGSPHCPPHTTSWLTYCSAHTAMKKEGEG